MLNGAVHLAGAIVTVIAVFGADRDILTALPFGAFASILTVLLVAAADSAPVLVKAIRAR
jgi:hypothetical protein